ncbi:MULTISPECIES: Coenzyme F420 hydrogenase/dehydrogenase, beta subunit C-terminal domain [Clostridia]|uniref:Coenzyme F420 hydrogenase/dehydrogenase, beta subunit C-terminal domain n=1 Tax=Clostridia TaxID=186801 RepID=UPI0018F50E70|nr:MULTISPECIES: Coenzyme F420 hydrogenase/dehydrogenase, beta subunit C-terminal domain [Clostridia]
MDILDAYACYNLDEEIRRNSSSGGIFSCLADYVIEKQGIVYGVAMSEDCYSAEYIGVKCKEDLKKLRGSKYLQAKLGDTFQSIKKELRNGKIILFSGTGCQINGLKFFLGEDYDNLICVDVICHGVPSPVLWKKYAQYQEKKYNGKLIDINFRCKEKGWQDFGIKEILKGFLKNKLKKKYLSKDIDSYMQMFLRDYSLRPSCYECLAKKVKMADITIADFWGIENVIPTLNDEKGISLVLIRTEKGRKVFQDISNSMKVERVSYEDGVRKNRAEYSSAKKPMERETFFENMCNMSFNQLEEKYELPVKISFGIRIKIKILKFIKRIFSVGVM